MGFLLPSQPDITTEGPRLNSRTVQDSAYGNDVPICFGTVRVAGNVIWATEIQEQKVTDSQRVGGKGGGGKSTQTSITYLYYTSFAVVMGEGIGNDVLRIWADGKLIYNAKAGSNDGTKDGVSFRFYTGDETQLPDPLIVADKGANTPAHRGLCYIVFDNLPLKDFGNRIPSITAEINFETRTAEVVTTEVTATPVPTKGNGFTVDWQRDRTYVEAQDESATYAIQMSNREVQQTFPYFNVNGVNRLTGTLLGFRDGDSEFYEINPYTGLPTLTKAYADFDNDPNTLDVFGWDPFPGTGVGLTLVTNGYGNFNAWVTKRTNISDDIPRYVFHDQLEFIGELKAPGTDSTWGILSLCEGPPGYGAAFGGFFSSSQIQLTYFQVNVDVGTFGGLSPEVNKTALVTLTPGDLVPGATAFTTSITDLIYTAYDEASRGIVFGVAIDGDAHLVKISAVDGSVDWVVDVPFVRINSTGESDTRLNGGAWAYHNGTSIIRVNLATGVLDEELDGSRTFSGLGHDGTIFDDKTNSIYNYATVSSSSELRQHFLGGRNSTAAPVADIIDRINERVGLQPVGDTDVSQIDASVEGYIIDKNMTAKAALEPLAALFQFDVVERDRKLVFQERGGSSVVTISESDFVRTTPDAEQYQEKRMQEAELPARVSVEYVNASADFQTNTAEARRITGVDASVKSKNKGSVRIPAVITPNAGKQLAEKILFTAWLERSTFEFDLPQKYLYLDPSDIVQIDLNNGFSFRGRLDEANVGKDYTTRVDAIRENVGQYTSTVEADGGTGVLTPPFLQVTPSSAWILDMNLLRDIDDANNAAHRTYWAANNFGQDGWPGCVLQKTPDNATWSEIGQTLVGIPWGVTTSTLENPASYGRTDEVSTLDVALVQGADELESTTKLEMLNGANALLMLKGNGEIALLQYRDVTALGGNEYRFTGLLRGRRGTETMDRDFTGSEIVLFIVINDTLNGFLTSLDERSVGRTFKPVTFGQLFESAVAQSFTHTGRDLKPYAPCALKATLSGADTDLTWQRRTRLGGESDFADGGDGSVPLAESAEAYDIEIYDDAGTTIVRTITGNSSRSFTYTAAMQSADGLTALGAGSSVKFTVFQKSAILGRGYPATETVEVVE